VAQLGSKEEYALLAAMDLAANYGPETPVSVQEIAERTGAPAKFLSQILLRLKDRALVRSSQGRSGGYRLMRRPELISVAEVLEAVSSGEDGRRRRGLPDSPYSGALDWLKKEMADARRGLLSTVTLADFVQRASPAA